ncbi:antibiotic biosynthesis monooxygenase family protein [Salisediminibacterium halotolerans]|uniref:Heme oxygenase (Staphylobilin-producing) n=1 Tax=Salisediminibacterium halotolerans TaxID=517425 RepID=A0A1H9TP04_9BACI|nr:antibiotic biosynthesis monooxygenase [Salisediminibacterium haloalkalitolerans]SER98373.1 heme oxygenase (staphylobilin-producing) [Salisediminibacterium haloalkalitolerans]
MYVVMNELHVPPEGRENVAERFSKSAEKMKEVPGCLDFMFLHPANGEHDQVVLTKWSSKEDYHNWINSQSFKDTHKKRRENLDESPTQGNTIFEYEAVHHLE